jgi:hypothetical protein
VHDSGPGHNGLNWKLQTGPKVRHKGKVKLSIDLLKPDPLNARQINGVALGGLSVSAETFGDLSGITWNEHLGLLVTGHQRMKVLTAAGATEWVREGDTAYVAHPKTMERFWIRVVRWNAITHRMAELTANNPHIQGDYQDEMVAAQLAALENDEQFAALQLDALAEQLAADEGDANDSGDPGNGAGNLAERFLVPPFSVLDARQGYWQDRKRAWLSLGIKSELGRIGGVTWGDSPQVTEPGLNFYRNENREGITRGILKASEEPRDGKIEPGAGPGRVLK